MSEQAQLKRLRAKPLAAAKDRVLLAIYNIIRHVKDAGLSSPHQTVVALQII